MPPAESRVKMNGFAAPDTAAVICSAAIKRGFAAPSPGFPAHNFIFSESNLRKILDSTISNSIRQFLFRIALPPPTYCQYAAFGFEIGALPFPLFNPSANQDNRKYNDHNHGGNP